MSSTYPNVPELLTGGVLSIGLILGCVTGVFLVVLVRVLLDAATTLLVPLLSCDAATTLLVPWPGLAVPCVDWPGSGGSGVTRPNLASLEEVGRLANSSAVKRDIIAGEFTNPCGNLQYRNCCPDGELKEKKSLLFGSNSHDSKALYMSRAE